MPAERSAAGTIRVAKQLPFTNNAFAVPPLRTY
jgi:hypothetical protein